MGNKYTKLILFIFIIIIGLVSCSSSASPDSRYSNSLDFTDFDTWLTEEVGVSGTPAFVFIKDGKVTNVVNHTINYYDFYQEYANETISIDIPYELNYDVIYVVREGCDSCKFQEENYQSEIYKRNSELKFLQYWILTVDCNEGCE